MSATAPSRQLILDRISAATQDAAKDAAGRAAAYAALPRGYARRGLLNKEERVELMIERLREYDAEVVESLPTELPAAIEARLATSGRRKFVVPTGVPAEWGAFGFDWKLDHGLITAEVEQAEGVVTAATCGIADSGTIVLHHTAAEGRRILTLLPDWHLCILLASQVVETLPEYFDRCKQPPALVTWISGPSATADIEMTRIKGVHGPRFLHVILVRDESSAETYRSAAHTELRPEKSGSARIR
jgi:L-lactate dehydrogenase complex protein LldG